MSLINALSRTILLMRDEINDTATDQVLVSALTSTHVALVADAANIDSHSAQSALITAALLMARSGHAVSIHCPPCILAGQQLPLKSGDLVEELVRVGKKLLPGISFTTTAPEVPVDLVVALGDSLCTIPAVRLIRINASAWSGRIGSDSSAVRWPSETWPFGGMAAACMAAAETFKIALWKLAHLARNPSRLESVFSPVAATEFALAPADTPITANLGNFDCVSGGAITSALLYALVRVPKVRGDARVIEFDVAELSNLNRYMLLLRDSLGAGKSEGIATALGGSGIAIAPIVKRYDDTTYESLAPLAPSILVGVDDIPSRWQVQRDNPRWLGIGATSHWSAMTSFHVQDAACAQCLHPHNEPGVGPIPTVAFVSFLAGLLTATYFLRHRSGSPVPLDEQQIYVTAVRPENPYASGVQVQKDCPTCAIIRVVI